jgi:uncharacterized protein YciI
VRTTAGGLTTECPRSRVGRINSPLAFETLDRGRLDGAFGCSGAGDAHGSRPQPIRMRPLVHTFHMDYYLLEYALIDDYLARRAAFREAHLRLAREAHRRGDLILAGALAEPPDRAALVWRTEDRSVVERFIDGDPYVRNGLVTSWTIRPWTVVIGGTAGQS